MNICPSLSKLVETSHGLFTHLSLGDWSLAAGKAGKDREENPALHWQSGYTWTHTTRV